MFQTCGVSHIEETEDFIESLGRLASTEEEINFNEEVGGIQYTYCLEVSPNST